jgi:hypothetical protein
MATIYSGPNPSGPTKLEDCPWASGPWLNRGRGGGSVAMGGGVGRYPTIPGDGACRG